MIKPEEITSNRIVVDTDVFSYIFRKDQRAKFFEQYLINKTLALSFMTVGELFYGAYKDNWGINRITKLEKAMKLYVILPYDYLVSQHWGQIKKEKEEKGLSMSHSDLWVAAAARRHDCPLATNNGEHFKNIDGLLVISPTLI